jgi:hypothetical protein
LNCSVLYATLPFIRSKNNNLSENRRSQIMRRLKCAWQSGRILVKPNFIDRFFMIGKATAVEDSTLLRWGHQKSRLTNKRHLGNFN